ncbi:MAG: peptidylprolyl isomerase [Bacteroidota bacterium]
MAIIGKIRNNSMIIIIAFVIVGIAMLYESFKTANPNFTLFGDNTQYGIGTVYGEKMDPNKYSQISARVQDQDRMQAQQQQKEFGEREIESSNDKSWNFMVDSVILKKEYDALGISVSDREFNAYLMATDGFSVLQDLSQFFTDSLTGTITEQSTIKGRQKLQSTLNQLKTNKDPQAVQQWNSIKQSYSDRRKQEKYLNLLGQGIYVTKLEAENEYKANNEKKNISFVMRRYTEINDADIKIKDEELKAYYDEHKSDSKYAIRSSSREVRMFDVVIAPSRQDSSMSKRLMSKLKSDFQKSVNDSIFVMKNSYNKMYFGDKRATAVPQGNEKANRFQTYPGNLDTVFKKAAIGQVVGPYYSGENVIVSKVIGFTPAKLSARHILIAADKSKDAKQIAIKKKTADSLLKLINKDNFTTFVDKFSEDPGSKTNGGKYENFLEGEMVKEFSDFCATQPIGKIGVVKTDFGFHIIEVLDRSADKLPLLVSVTQPFKASEATISSKESEVTQILYKLDRQISKESDPLKKVALFDTIVTKAKKFPRPIQIEDNSAKVFGFTTSLASDKILELAYGPNVEVGSLTSYPIKDKDKYIIAMVSSIKEKGEPKYEDVKAQMEKDLIEEKKAERLINQMAKIKSLDKLAKSANTAVMTADVNFGSPQISNGGYEPEIVGALFSAIKDKKRTLPLKGKNGVYVIIVNKTVKAPSANTNVERDQLLTTLKGSAQTQALEALRKKADVVDNRKLFDLRIRQ